MTKQTVHAFKDKACWYVDDANGFSKADNQLVGGVPEIIECIAGKAATRVSIDFSIEPFADSVCLSLLSGTTTGSTYRGTIDGREMEGWLCPVFFHYFKEAPQRLYIKIRGA